MTVSINTDELLTGIRETFFQEANGIEDAVASSKDSGILSEVEFERAFTSTDATIRNLLDRYVGTPSNALPNNGAFTPDTFEYNIAGSPRVFFGRETTIAELLHDAFVENMLSELFKNLSPDASSAHSDAFKFKMTSLQALLMTKRPPKFRF